MKILETDRLIFREISADDADFIHRLMNEPSYLRFIGDRGLRTIDDARAYIERTFVANYQRNGFGLWLVALKDGGAPAGICGLIRRPALDDVDIGFAFLSEFRSRGYAFESASAVMAYGRDVIKLGRIVAITTQDNADSMKLLQKLGFRLERLVTLPNDNVELNLFAWDA